MKSPDEKSWFNRIRDLLYRYDLPSPSVLLEQPISKSKWKSMIDNATHAEVEGTWREDIQLKRSLKYINPNKVKMGIVILCFVKGGCGCLTEVRVSFCLILSIFPVN